MQSSLKWHTFMGFLLLLPTSHTCSKPILTPFSSPKTEYSNSSHIPGHIPHKLVGETTMQERVSMGLCFLPSPVVCYWTDELIHVLDMHGVRMIKWFSRDVKRNKRRLQEITRVCNILLLVAFIPILFLKRHLNILFYFAPNNSIIQNPWSSNSGDQLKVDCFLACCVLSHLKPMFSGARHPWGWAEDVRLLLADALGLFPH